MHFPAFRVLSLDLANTQICFDVFETDKDTVAFKETVFIPTRFAKVLTMYDFFLLMVLEANSAAAARAAELSTTTAGVAPTT